MAQSPELDHLIAAMSRYVIDLPRAIAIHLPKFENGKVIDIEFIWGNRIFQSWQSEPLREGGLGSKTRKEFDQLLPHLNKAWFDGQSIQFFSSSNMSTTQQVEVETIWSKAEDVIVEWGDDINSKIQHGSAVEAERHQKLMDAVEAERDSFVQEIHDNVLQDLHILTMNMASKLNPSLDKDQLLSESWNLQLALQKIQKDLDYQMGFLKSVRGKLSNERFVSSAPEVVVANERKKEADAIAKIEIMEEKLLELG